MPRGAAVGWIGLFAVLAVLGSRIDFSRDGGRSHERDGPLGSTGQVVRVIDGDTVRMRIGGRTLTVRYIGVDTPETVKPNEPVQCFGRQASAFNKRLVEGRRVRLQYGPERHDRFGRVLAYVYVPGNNQSVSAQLVAGGYGRVLAIAPNIAHLRPYLKLEENAQRRGLGLWAACRGRIPGNDR
jgi:micrococcal nuclease